MKAVTSACFQPRIQPPQSLLHPQSRDERLQSSACPPTPTSWSKLHATPQPRMINHLDTARHMQPQPTIGYIVNESKVLSLVSILTTLTSHYSETPQSSNCPPPPHRPQLHERAADDRPASLWYTPRYHHDTNVYLVSSVMNSACYCASNSSGTIQSSDLLPHHQR